MAKKEGPLTVAFAQYPDPDTAKDALHTLQQMEKDGAIDVIDAGVIEKQADGKAKISDVQKHARRKNAGEGAIIGGVASLLFPPGLIAGVLVGGVAGGVVGRLRHHEVFKSKEMKQAAEQMPPGSSAIVAIIENKWLSELESATEGYENLITQSVDADAAASVTELVQQGAKQ
jgi:uncharacterized membrane protein